MDKTKRRLAWPQWLGAREILIVLLLAGIIFTMTSDAVLFSGRVNLRFAQPGVLVPVAVILTIVVLIACAVPAVRAARLDRAAALVVALPNPDVAEQVTAVARRTFPHLLIFARVPDRDWVRRLQKAGANAVVIEGLTTALELAERVILVYQPADV